MRILFSLLALALVLSVGAQGENDTLFIDKPDSVRIISGDSIVVFSVYGINGNKNYSYTKTIGLGGKHYESTTTIRSNHLNFGILGINNRDDDKHSRFEVASNLAFGFCSPLNAPADMNTKVFSSWEINWIVANLEYRPWKNKHVFSVGFGLDWRNYRMKDRKCFAKGDDGVVSIIDAPEGCDPQFSRIKVFSMNVPLLYTYNFNKNLGVSVGPVVNFNTHSSIKTRYKLNGEKYKESSDGLHTNTVTVDFMMVVNTYVGGVYCKYSPCNVLDTNYGPKFQSLSFGIFL